MENKNKLGIALVGLGEYATGQLIPALQETEHCYLAGIVSGSGDKKTFWKRKLNLKDENLFSYANFDEIADCADIDIVYVVLPNFMHAEYCIRAAQAGKHVICEKPLAMNLDECYQVRSAVLEAGVQFSMGYRLHFEPFNLEMMRLGQQQIFGEVTKMYLFNSMDIGNESPWRLDVERAGGGPLMNNGIYCIQAAIYLTGKLPIAVEAKFIPKSDPERFAEVEQGIQWTMFFENDVAAYCETDYVDDHSFMRAEASDGWFELDPAYAYKDLKGRTSEGPMEFGQVRQQALQMDDFALCVMNGATTRVPLSMGIRDMLIASAIYESARNNKKVSLHLDDFASAGYV